MNSQQHKTVQTDMNSTMISLQHHNLILRPNLKPKTTSHSQDKPIPVSPNALRFPLSVEGSASPKSTQSRPNNPSMYILLSGGLSADTNLCRLGLGIQPIKTLITYPRLFARQNGSPIFYQTRLHAFLASNPSSIRAKLQFLSLPNRLVSLTSLA